MFGLGMGEIVLIAIVALLFLGPDKLPSAAKTIGKTIRGLRAQTRDLTDSLERDTELGDAVRELRSALHDDPRRARPGYTPEPVQEGDGGSDDELDPARHEGDGHLAHGEHLEGGEHAASDAEQESDESVKLAAPILGEPDVPTVRPAAGSVARLYPEASLADVVDGNEPSGDDESEPKPAGEGKA